MNIAAGLGVGLAVAIAFALSDVAKILIPITCQAIGWTRHLKAVYAVAAVVSVLCASLYLADQFGEAIAAKENNAKITDATEQHIADLRASLTSAREMAASEAQRGGCGPKCQTLNDRVTKLETALSAAQSERKDVKASDVTDGKAVVIAGALGADTAATLRGYIICNGWNANCQSAFNRDPGLAREKELAELDQWLRGRPPYEHARVLVLRALGGMGKSALAWRWSQAHALEVGLSAGFEGVFWWCLRAGCARIHGR